MMIKARAYYKVGILSPRGYNLACNLAIALVNDDKRTAYSLFVRLESELKIKL